jgi:hypothetical protein
MRQESIQNNLITSLKEQISELDLKLTQYISKESAMLIQLSDTSDRVSLIDFIKINFYSCSKILIMLLLNAAQI